jgi:hypothetical protein
MKKLVKRKTISAGERPPARNPLVGTWENTEPKVRIPVRYNHPLVGFWQEVENPVNESSVVYNVAVIGRRFVVSGIDEEKGMKLEISGVRWDGRSLHFTSVYPTNGYRAKHELRARRPGLMNHWVTSTDLEIWRKRPQKRNQTHKSK